MMDADPKAFGPLIHQTVAWAEIVSLMAPYKIALYCTVRDGQHIWKFDRSSYKQQQKQTNPKHQKEIQAIVAAHSPLVD